MHPQMSQEQQYDAMPKGHAISIISLRTGRGRGYVQDTLNRLEREGRIHLQRAPFSNALLISQTDIDIVITAIRDSAPSSEKPT
jgi:hypothetical protein